MIFVIQKPQSVRITNETTNTSFPSAILKPLHQQAQTDIHCGSERHRIHKTQDYNYN